MSERAVICQALHRKSRLSRLRSKIHVKLRTEDIHGSSDGQDSSCYHLNTMLPTQHDYHLQLTPPDVFRHVQLTRSVLTKPFGPTG